MRSRHSFWVPFLSEVVAVGRCHHSTSGDLHITTLCFLKSLFLVLQAEIYLLLLHHLLLLFLNPAHALEIVPLVLAEGLSCLECHLYTRSCGFDSQLGCIHVPLSPLCFSLTPSLAKINKKHIIE